MWSAHCEKLSYRGALRFTLTLDSLPITYEEVLRLWRSDAIFRTFFNSILANCEFNAFRWETPAITSQTAERQFEFVLLDSPELNQEAEPEAFQSQFRANNTEQTVIEFPNLGGDAILVVPTPSSKTSPSPYGHIAAFVRSAPEPQRQALWEMVATAMERRLNELPVWLSTAGAGVPWLHVRLDNRPKYYGYDPYRKSDYSRQGQE